MIIEEKLKELFETLPNVTDLDSTSFEVKVDFGSEKDCYIFLDDNRDASLASYPLVWIQTPIKSTGRTPKINTKVRLIIATLSKAHFTNAQRIEYSFKPLLQPILDNAIKALNRSGFTKLLNTDREDRVNHFKYSVNDKNPTTDVWDAITYDVEIEMSECPLRTINY